jgi:membrane protease YdiL (CAAX protease family)
VENISQITDEPLESPTTAAKTPRPDDPPWGSLIAIGLWVLSIVLIAIFGVLLLIPYLASVGIGPSDETVFSNFVRTDAMAVFLQMIGIIPAHLLTLLAAWFVVTRNRKYSFREMLGWDWGGFKLIHAIVATIIFYLLSIAAVSYFGDVENDFDIMLKSSRYIIYLVAFFAVFTAPIVEEVVYRGVLYSAFQRTVGKVVAVIAVTVMFASVHALQYSTNATPDYAVMSVLILLSLLLTVIRAQTGNLLPCIVLHTVFNAFQSAVMIGDRLYSGYEAPGDTMINLILR